MSGYEVGGGATDSIVQQALDIATGACNEIQLMLSDLHSTGVGDGLANKITANEFDTSGAGGVLVKYGVKGGVVDITEASGAMVIDDMMQKISTSVQVAAQMLSTANNIAKSVARRLDS